MFDSDLCVLNDITQDRAEEQGFVRNGQVPSTMFLPERKDEEHL